MMKRLGLKVGFAMMLSFAAGREAAAEVMRCDGCAYWQAQQLAAAHGQGVHPVFDFRNGSVMAFSVGYDEKFGMVLTLPVDPTPQEVDLAQKLGVAFALNDGNLAKTVEVSSDSLGVNGLGGATALDVVGSRNLRIAIGERLSRGIPSDSAADSTMVVMELFYAAGLKYMGIAGEITLRVTIVFNDGSKVTFKATPDGPELECVEGSARDNLNQGVIEANGTEYQDFYEISDHFQLQNWLNHARNLGVQITNGGPGRYNCRWNGETLHCTRVGG